MFNKLFNSFITQRLIISGFTYIISLYLAKKMGPVAYGPLAFLVFFLKNIPSMNLGISYGFIFQQYKTDGTSYINNYVRGYCLIGICVLLIGEVFINRQILIYGLLLLPIFILDPLLKMKRIFICSLIPEFFLLIAFGVSYWLLEKTGFLYFTSALIILLFLLIIFLYIYKNYLNEIKINTDREKSLSTSYQQFNALIKKGFSSYLYLLVFFLFLLTDRYMLQKYYPGKALGVCMVAVQLCQASLYLMSSWNFSSIIDIGELIKSKKLNNYYVLNRLGLIAIMGAIPLFVLYWGLLITKSYFLVETDYQDLLIVYPIVATGLYFSNLLSSISPILFFAEKQVISVIGMVCCLIVVIISYSLSGLYEWSYITVIRCSYLSLTLCSIVIVSYALYILQGMIVKKTSFCENSITLKIDS